MKLKLYFLALLTLIISDTYAQSDSTAVEANPLTISGSVDVYYRTSFTDEFFEAPATSFANLPGFSLGMANIILEQEKEKVGFKADLVFGPRGEDATFLSSELRPGGSSNVVNQLYAYWMPTEALKITVGNFNTFLGYEVISPLDNFNYSTSYMFSFGPFSHTGLKVDYALDNGFSVMASFMNPTDFTEYNPFDDYAQGLQLGYENHGLGVWVNGIFAEDFTQFDITAGYEVSDAINVGLNATTASDNFTGVAVYFQVATSESLELGLRAERFTDDGLGLLTEGNSVLDFTLSAKYTVGNLTFIPEFRLDSFNSEDAQINQYTSDTLSSFLLAAVYGF